jgi:hypothetical protein
VAKARTFSGERTAKEVEIIDGIGKWRVDFLTSPSVALVDSPFASGEASEEFVEVLLEHFDGLGFGCIEDP